MANLYSAPNTSAAQTHPLYDMYAPVWRRQAFVFEGNGPFFDGTALVAHPREHLDSQYVTKVPETETGPDGVPYSTGRMKTVVTWNPNPSKPSRKLLERRQLARYENLAAPIVNHKLAALFRKEPDRRVNGGAGDQEHDWLKWCQDVDGSGTSYTDFMRDAWRFAAIFGHSVIVMDRLSTVANPMTRAEQGQPILRLYSALDLFDWLTDEAGNLTGVRLYEVAPRQSFEESPSASLSRYRMRTLTAEKFVVSEEAVEKVGAGPARVVDQKVISEGEHGFGALPVVMLYGRRRALTPIIGDSIIGDPQMHYDLYNLTSEKRELLRKQTFSVLNIPLGTGPDRMSVEDAQAMAGETSGTVQVLFTGLPATYITAEAENATVYQDEIDACKRTIYRLANVPFESDSKDAESADSLRLKREDMNQVLSSYADECQTSEEGINILWFRAQFGNKWEAEYEKVRPESIYPHRFDIKPFEELIAEAQAAQGLPIGRSKTFVAEHSKRMVNEMLPDLSEDKKAAIEKEIEALPDPETERKQEREANLAAMRGEFEPKPGEDEAE